MLLASARSDMSQSTNNNEVVEHIVKLRVQAAATLELYEKIHGRIEFYRKYISLAKNHKVRLAGSLIVIQGGRSTEDARSDAKAAAP
jgi:hypothetical protein